jgi:hypothetical protein
MNLKKIALYGGALYLALLVYRQESAMPKPKQKRLTAFDA